MADKTSSSLGTTVLCFATFFNFAALLSLAVYHIHFERQFEKRQLTSTKDVLQSLIDELKSVDVISRRRRAADGSYDGEGLSAVVKELAKVQRSLSQQPCSTGCRSEVIKVMKEIYDVRHTSDINRRQSQPTGELAQIFSEIAKSEINILQKYCTNGSAVCLPGEKGAPGLKGNPGVKGDRGSPGLDGAQGQRGPKGEQGINGLTGQKGDTGLSGQQGQPGVKGEKGDPGARGPTGLKGEKGDTARAALVATPPPVPTPKPTACCVNLALPGFTVPSEQITVTEGSNIRMMCDASGYPPPRHIWNPPVASLDQSRFVAGSDYLSINNAKTTDGNIYSCIAQNALGDAEKQFVVQVIQHLNFEKVPQNVTVMMGTSVVLECRVDGPLNPDVKWFKVMPDGSRFELKTGITPVTHGSQLTVTGITAVTAGQYVCEGNNGVEQITAPAYISTYGPPHIKPPGTVTAIKGQTVRLKCEADAHPPAVITWTYPPGVTNAYKDTDGSLVILNVQPKDSTNFFCHATNKYGTDDATLKLEVKVPPEVTVTPSKVPILGAGAQANVALQCKAVGDQPLSVSWFKNGQPVTNDGHVFVLTGNVLLVNAPTTAADLGAYMCSASNPLGTAQATAYTYDNKGTITCQTKFSSCTSAVCGVTCPAGCAADATPVYGIGTYHKDSSACKAGIQSGAITDAGGLLIWSTSRGVTSFTDGTKNGIASVTHAKDPSNTGLTPVV